jgi:hypothetical protein
MEQAQPVPKQPVQWEIPSLPVPWQVMHLWGGWITITLPDPLQTEQVEVNSLPLPEQKPQGSGVAPDLFLCSSSS